MKNIAALVAALALCGTAVADEKKIQEAETPKPVLAKVKQKYPNAKMIGFELEQEGGKSTYEIKMADGARQFEVVCSPEGKILAEEEKIAIDKVPEKIRESIKSSPKYGSWTVHHAERVIVEEKTDAPRYEVKLVKGSTGAELVFSPDGKLLKTEEKEWHEKRK